MNKHIANIFSFLLASPDNTLIFLAADPRGNALSNFMEITGTPQSCVTAYLGEECLATTLSVRPPNASELHARCLVYHSDPKQLHDLAWAVADAAPTFGYKMSPNNISREEPMRLGQARYLRFNKEGLLELGTL